MPKKNLPTPHELRGRVKQIKNEVSRLSTVAKDKQFAETLEMLEQLAKEDRQMVLASVRTLAKRSHLRSVVDNTR